MDINRVNVYITSSWHLVSVCLGLLILNSFVQNRFTAQDVVTVNGMVASAQPLASKAGLEILEKGGNAVDAAVATAFALSVVEPNASGLGGGGFMVIKMADSSEAITIDYREIAPGFATPQFYYQTVNSFDSLTINGAYSIGVPGVVAGLCLALKKYGTMTLSEVLLPAIQHAENGFNVTENFSAMIFQNYELIQRYPVTTAIYLKEGLPPEIGSLITNPSLAMTFEKIAAHGPDIFYSGQIGAAIIQEIKKFGGGFTKEDLKKYKAIIRQPVIGSYKRYEILSSSPPTGGGTHLVELLNILGQYDLKNYQHNSADYIHLLAEAMKIVLADKNANMADPEFYAVPTSKLTDKDYAASRMKFIDMKKASFSYLPPEWVERESGNTTHLSVVDKDRNIVALTQSINSWFGSGITVQGTGIILNNHLKDFQKIPGRPNSIEPYKRPVSSIAPTILLKDGMPFLTIGTPGGTRIISALAQIILNIVDFEMGMDEAIEVPRIHAYGKSLYLEGRIDSMVVKELETRGHNIKLRDDFDNYFGGAQGILIDEKENKLYGGADSRRDGFVVGN
jgi:gamma-glutamyltranspeptidase/glutathione hydrolase